MLILQQCSSLNTSFPKDVNILPIYFIMFFQLITIVFELFQLEDGTNCKYDKLAFYKLNPDNSKGQRVAAFCGSKLPETVHNPESMLIEFTSDQIIEKSGFRLKFFKMQGTGMLKWTFINFKTIVIVLFSIHQNNFTKSI